MNTFQSTFIIWKLDVILLVICNVANKYWFTCQVQLKEWVDVLLRNSFMYWVLCTTYCTKHIADRFNLYINTLIFTLTLWSRHSNFPHFIYEGANVW